MQKVLFSTLSILALLAVCQFASLAAEDYKSPYSIAFTLPREELTQADSQSPRNSPKLESKMPFEEWYSGRTRKELGSWGPRARQFPPIGDLDKLPLAWKQQRLLTVASRWEGLPYQHHHIPDWDPPQDWPWQEVKYGHNSPGIDCSDFTSWIYNYGLGIKLPTAIGEQANLTEVSGPGGEGTIECETIVNDGGYESLINKLRTGDLLYIKNNGGKVSHVIMWVGEYGKNPDKIPLIIDSTGTGHKDSNGVDIPIGIHLRPFTKDCWYFHDFSHAHRILR